MGKTISQITFEFNGNEAPMPINPAVLEENETMMKDDQPTLDQESEDKPAPVKAQLSQPVSKRGRKSLKEIADSASLVQVPEDEILFKKQYYPIGEVAAMFNENQSLIRYWETEFDILQPRKNRKGDRFFRPVDIKNLVMIYDLLRRRKFTIEGAKEYLKKDKKAEEKFAMIKSLEKIKAFLLELKANL